VCTLDRFAEVARLLCEEPGRASVHGNPGRFQRQDGLKILQEVEVDAAVFSEPIGGNTGRSLHRDV